MIKQKTQVTRLRDTQTYNEANPCTKKQSPHQKKSRAHQIMFI